MVQVNIDGSNQAQDSSTSFLGDQDIPWSEKWKEMLSHLLKMKDLFAQLQYITNGILPAMQGYTEGQMGGEAGIMDKLSRLLRDENIIQAAFNQATNSNAGAGCFPQAVAAANDILNILRTDPAFKNDKDLLSSVELQLGKMFGIDLSGNNTVPTPGQPGGHDAWWSWVDAWYQAQRTDGKASNAELTSYNQAFTSVSTEFNSQSSIAQSKFKYLQANEQQYLGIEQSMASNFIKLEEAANNGIAK